MNSEILLNQRVHCVAMEKVGFLNRVTTWLTFLGIVGSWCSWIVLCQTVGLTAQEGFSEAQSKPFAYYIFHGVGICAVIAAGILASLNGQYKRLNKISRAAFWMLQIASITWAVITYELGDYLSWKALGATGPFVWITCVLVFAGMDRSIWKVLDPAIRLISYITAVLAFYAMSSQGFMVVERWFSANVRYMILLMWFGGWTFLTSLNCNGWRLLLRCFPFTVLILTTVATLTRSWFLMSGLLTISLWFVAKRYDRNGTKIRFNWVINTSLLVVFLSSAGLFLSSSTGAFVGESLYEAFIGLTERALLDSRSGQYVEFFSQVSIQNLILGRGPNGTWSYFEIDYQFIDNAYLWMAFIGGLPVLVSYFILIILPGLRGFLGSARENDAAAVVLVMLWGLACTGFSTYVRPSLSPYCYLLYLMAGRCIGHLAEKREFTKYARIQTTASGIVGRL